MEFEVRDQVEENGVRVIAVRGELDLGTVDELRRLLPERFSVTAPAVIDLSECTFIDSTGLASVFRAYRRAEADGHPGLMLVAAPGSQVRRVLGLTGLDSHLPVVDSRDAAAEAVSHSPLVAP